MDLLTSETCWTLNKVIINKWHQVGLSLLNYQDDARSNKHKISQEGLLVLTVQEVRLRLKCDGTRAETRFRLSAKRRGPFKSAGGVSSVDYWQPRFPHQR